MRPVDAYETLLVYLVRCLLENGANTSFVNRIVDISVPLEQLIADPAQEVTALTARAECESLLHLKIPLLRDLYGSQRRDAGGLVWPMSTVWRATPLIVGEAAGPLHSVRNPAESRDVVDEYRFATHEKVTQALAAAAHHS